MSHPWLPTDCKTHHHHHPVEHYAHQIPEKQDNYRCVQIHW